MVITSTLLTRIRSDVKTDLQALFTHGAIGTGTTAATAADTTLETEVFRDTIDTFDTSASDKVVATLIVGLSEANSNAISEVGWLDAGAAGNLWTHNIITVINKTSDIQLFLDTSITITVTET